MSEIPASDELQKTIGDFTRACERWQRAATSHSALVRVQEGELTPPVFEFSIKGETGEPMRVTIDMSHMNAKDMTGILNPVIDFLYGEYKQSLLDAGMAATASHRLLEAQERMQDNPAS